MIRIYLLFILSAVFTLGSANASEIVFGDTVEKINLIYGEETILRFPSQVKTISNVSDFEIAPVDKNDPDYTLLSIKPIFRKSKGKVLFVLEDGTVLRTSFRAIKKNSSLNNDSFYEFVSKKQIVNKTQNLTTISELELLKAMVRDDSVTGYKRRKLVRTIWGINKMLNVKLVRTYSGKRFNGYIFKIENKTNNTTVQINPEAISLGNPNQAIMSQVDDENVYSRKMGKSVTYLRIVAKPSSVYSDIKLPFAITKGGNND